jgi:putative flippase GtrA
MFERFLVVGALGFVVDALALYGFIALGLGALAARLPAFLIAAFVTWIAHRKYTFREAPGQARAGGWLSYVQYSAATTFGALANLCGYWLTLILTTASPLVALAAGSAIGLILNYTMSRRWIFR